MSRMKISLLYVFTLCMISAHAATFNIVNRCSYTVWPATFLASSSLISDGFQLNSGQTRNVDVPAGTAGRIWGRTGCKFDMSGGGRCETGDCGGGLKCGNLGNPPNTLAEFLINDENDVNKVDYFDISVSEGFNIPMQFASTSNGCNKVLTCRESSCPDAYQFPRGTKTNKTVSCPEGTNYRIVFCP